MRDEGSGGGDRARRRVSRRGVSAAFQGKHDGGIDDFDTIESYSFLSRQFLRVHHDARAPRSPFLQRAVERSATQTSSWAANPLGECPGRRLLARARTADLARGPRRPFPCRGGPVSFRVSGRCRALRGSTSRFRAPVADRVLSSRTLPSLPTQPLRARYHPGLQAVRRRPHRRTSPARRAPRASRANENPAGFARDARRGGDRDDRRDTRNAGTTACRYAFTVTRVALPRNTRGRVDATRRRRSFDRASGRMVGVACKRESG